MKNRILSLTLIIAGLITVMVLLPGCGSGGGGAPAVLTGQGRVGAIVQLRGDRTAARTAAQSASGAVVAVSITGMYAGTSNEFPAVTAQFEVDSSGHVSGDVMNVPVGYNHVATCVATYAGGNTETVRALIPSVADGAQTDVVVDSRSTVIADAAIQIASEQGKTLPEIEQERVTQLTTAVDAIYSAGTDYPEISLTDVINYQSNAGTPSQIVISPASAVVSMGQTQEFTAAIQNAYGETLSGGTVTWSADSALGTITSGGVFSASTVGSGVVTATYGGIIGTAPVAVIDGSVVSVSISPASASVTSGATQQFAVSVLDSGGNTVAVTPAWSVSGGIGTMAADGTFTAGTAGSGSITATVNTVSQTASVTVTPGALDTMTIAPSSATVLNGETLQFTATGADANGNTVSANPTWAVTGGIGSIDTAGLFTASAVGSGAVTATSGSVTASVDVTVIAANIASITVSPATATVQSGATQQFTATVLDTDGAAVSVTPTWAVTGGVGAVDGDGLFTGGATGSGGVTATAGGVTGSATVTVTAANNVPVANAGIDQSGQTGVTVTLDGTSSSDADSEPLTYAWTQSGGPTITLSSTTAASPTFLPVTAGTYIFSLTVNDGQASSNPDTVTITVTQSTTPSVTGITPATASNVADTSVTITGVNFLSGATVLIGATSATGVTIVNSTTITATAPAGMAVGSYDVVVTNPDAQAGTLTGGFFVTSGTGTSHSGAITTTSTWALADSPHIVTGDVTVDIGSGGALTIEPGCVVKFDTGTKLQIGTSNYASLIANGNSSPILFTSNSATPAAGDWQGIVFNTYTQSSTILDGATVEYAGNTTGAGVTVNAGTPTIQNSTLRYNSGLGLKFADTRYPAAFTGNTITGNTTYPIEIYANLLRYLSSGNTLTGNTNDAIKVMGDAVENTGTWANNGVPLEVQGDLSVNLGSGGILTIAAGSTLKFLSGTGMAAATSNYASIAADGSGGAITFTSAEATPAAGDWKGITFGQYGQGGTVLNNVIIEYGGNTTGANLTYTVNTGAITNSTIRYSSGMGVKFNDGGGGAGVFTGNTITSNTTHPIDIYANYASSLLSGNTLTGNGDDSIHVQADTVTTTGTWANNSVPYKALGAIYFQANNTFASGITAEFSDLIIDIGSGGVFTVGAGDTLKFASGTGLTVGTSNYASFIADGSGGAITFTSAEATPAAGDWKGITLNGYTQGSTIFRNVTIEYGGNTTSANLTANVNLVDMQNSTIRYSSGVGINFQDGGGGENSFTGNTITGNTLNPISIYANYMPTLQSGNTLTGNGVDKISVLSDSVTTAGTWPNNGIPVELQGALNINANTTFESNMTLIFLGDVNVDIGSGGLFTLGAYDTLKFSAGSGLIIGTGNYASLVADGSGGDITFTSNEATPSAGDWKGITFNSYTQGSTLLDSVIVEYAGNTTSAGVTMNSASPQIQNSVIRYNSGLGIKFADNMYPAAFTNNTVTGNSSYPMEIYANFLRTLISGNTYTGNGADAIKVIGDIVGTSGTWAYSGVPFEIQSDVTIDIGSGGTITIDPNSTLTFLSGSGLIVGASNYASLIADGSGGAITFTSAASTPANGDWNGLTFNSYTQGSTVLDNVVVSYGGANTKGNVYMNGSTTNVSLQNSTLSYSSTYGVYVTSGDTFSTPDETSCTFTGNTSGTVLRE